MNIHIPSFKDFFGSGQPQRRVLKGRITTDAQGNQVFQPLNGEAHSISDENSLDTVEPEFDAFLDCGCGVKSNQHRFHCCEPGCPFMVCEQHINYCQVCAKATCPQCTYPIELGAGQSVSLCLTHYREASRRRWWQRATRMALRPFVSFDEEEGAK